MSTGTPERPAVTVWGMEEGGAVVKTGGGVDAARTAYAVWLEQQAGDDLTAAEWSVPREEIPGCVDRATYIERWYRWTPCNPRSCYEGTQHRPGHLEYAQAPGRGVWRGVAVYP